MTREEISFQRLANQHLIGESFKRPDEVVRWLVAVQSQDYVGAKWGVAQRTTGATSRDIDRLFDEGAILRTHVMRPTWHFVMPEDIRWLLHLTAPRVRAVSASYFRKMELDAAVFGRCNALLTDALQGGQQLTRLELAQALQRGGIEASGTRLAYIMINAELDGLVCSGALRGKQFTYALLEERVPPVKPLDRGEALAELTRRYFTSHGPATAQDFGWWSGLSAADVRAGIENVKSALDQETIDGKTYWSAPTQSLPQRDTPIIHLLPNYDEHLIAYKDYAPSFDPQVFAHLDPNNSVLGGHIIVLNGKVIGGWSRTIKKSEVVITTKLLISLTANEIEALHAEAKRYGQFLEIPARVEMEATHDATTHDSL